MIEAVCFDAADWIVLPQAGVQRRDFELEMSGSNFWRFIHEQHDDVER